MTSDELRKTLKRYHRRCDEIKNNFITTGIYEKPPRFPEECIGMVCGAKTKLGLPCPKTTLFKNGRCRIHGGLSTGPKTLEGKQRSALNTGKTYEELLKSKKTC